MEIDNDKEIQILYDVADASWVSNVRSVCDIVLFENHIVKTIFDFTKQRFVSLFAAKLNSGGVDSLADILPSFADKDKEIQKRLFVSVPKTLLTPSVLFDEKMQTEMLANQHKIENGNLVHSYPVKRIDAQMIFAIDKGHENLKNNYSFKINQFIPIDTAWLDSLYLNYKDSIGLHAHINISDGFISIAVFKDGGLQFYNTFNTITPEGILYFTMFVSEQLRLNPQRDPYFYSGLIKKADETLNLLIKYIKFIKPEERPSQYSYCMPMLDVPGHLFYNAYCTPVCEL